MKLTPVDYDPFAPTLTPIDYDPFKAESRTWTEALLTDPGTGIGAASLDMGAGLAREINTRTPWSGVPGGDTAFRGLEAGAGLSRGLFSLMPDAVQESGIGQAVGGQIDKATAGLALMRGAMPEEDRLRSGFVDAAADVAGEMATRARDTQSDKAKSVRQKIAEAADEGFFSTMGYVLGEAARGDISPLAQLTESLVPSMAAGGVAARFAGTPGMLATMAAVEGTGAGDQARQSVLGAKQEVLDADPIYQGLVAELGDPGKARIALADMAGSVGSMSGAVASAALMGIGQKFGFNVAEDSILGKVSAGMAARSVPGRIGIGVTKEGVSEGTQEGANAIAANLGSMAGGVEDDLMAGVGGAVATGVLAGAPSGALAGLVKPETPAAAAGAKTVEDALRDAGVPMDDGAPANPNAVDFSGDPPMPPAGATGATPSPQPKQPKQDDADAELDALLAPLEPVVTNTQEDARGREPQADGGVAAPAVDGIGDSGAARPAADTAASPARGAATARPFDPVERSRADFEQRLAAVSEDLTPEQVERVRSLYREPARDRVTGLYRGEEMRDTLDVAWEDSDTTPAVYVEMDMANLGGLNTERGNSGADPYLKRAGEIARDELAKVGATVAIRKGGDEFGYVVRGADQATVDAAMLRAQDAFAAEMAAEGLDVLPNPKPGRVPGVGIVFGSSPLVRDVPIADTVARADTLVEKRKKEGKHGHRAREAAGDPRAAGTEATGTVGQAAGGTRPEVQGGRGETRAPAAAEAQGLTQRRLTGEIFPDPENRTPIGLRGQESDQDVNRSRRQEVPFDQRNLARLPAVPTDETRALARRFRLPDVSTIAEVARRDLPRDLAAGLESFEEATGTRVVVTKGLPAQGVNLRDGTLYVDVSTEAPLLTTAAHEWVHQLRADNPTLFNLLRDEVRRQGRMPEWTAELKRRTSRDGDDAGKVTEDLASEELTADAVADALTDPAFLRELAARKPSVFRRVIDNFLRYLDRVISRFQDTGSSEYMTDVKAFRDVLADVLERFQADATAEARAQGVDIAFSKRRSAKAPDPADVVGIMAKRESVPKMKGKTEVAQFLQDRAMEKRGRVLNIENEADRDLVADDMVTEALFELENSDSAVEWYDETINKTMGILALKHPEIETNPDARTAFTIALAVTSQNMAVPDNLKAAEVVYAEFKKTGRFPVIGFGGKGGSMKKNFKVANLLLDELESMAEVRDFLARPMTVRQINALGYKKVGGELLDAEVLGSSVFGPKIGFGFYSNLTGNFEPVTMDMWFMRTIGRLTGRLMSYDPEKFAKQLDKLRVALDKPKARKASLIREAYKLARAHEKDFKVNRALYDSGERKKSASTNAAINIVKSLKDTRDAPGSGEERRLLRDIVSRALAKLKDRTGRDVPAAAFQALIWYPEQDLYKSLGVKLKHVRQDYAKAAKAFIAGEGFSEREIDEAASRAAGRGLDRAGSRAGDARPRDGVQIGRGTAADGARAGRGAPPAESVLLSRRRSEPGRDGGRRSARGRTAPLEGAPSVAGVSGPDPRLVDVAERYAQEAGITLRRQGEYVKVDPDRAARIAQAYADMEHAPNDPRVREAYADLIRQTTAQYRALEDAGYRFWFIDTSRPDNAEYASTPWNALRSMREDQTMGVFPTNDGFGSNSDFSPEANPLLAETGIEWPVGGPDGPMQPVLANDLFRAVHDAFGHGMEGAGFRARGEENAWQAHVRLFTGPAVGAITSETRGQNSWLNYGPNGEQNRGASVDQTIFADQKTGLMPEWTWTEGLADDMPETSEPLFSRRRDRPFYSAMTESVSRAQGAPKMAKAGPWKQWLDGAVRRGEFKQSERDWLGVDAWLDAQDKPITREALAAFVRANEVSVEEVVLGDSFASMPMDRLRDQWEKVFSGDASDLSRDEMVEMLEGEGDIGDRAMDGVPKYTGYRTPGGENYRELLLTLPSKMQHPELTPSENDEYSSLRARYDALDVMTSEERQRYHSLRDKAEGIVKTNTQYRSPHWAQPNVLAHVRFDERTDAEGKRVLFVQEIQSDWHQGGRKDGYLRKGVSVEEVMAEQRALRERRRNDQIETAEFYRELERLNDLLPSTRAVPNAPFKQTDEWAMLAFKRMARWAVDNGFDRIAWATGEMAADLFDLSKQIDMIEYEAKPDGTYDLSAMRGGAEVIGESRIGLDRVEAIVGKEIAEKIGKGEGVTGEKGNGAKIGQLSGLQLKVGGEGMRGFYDKILPAAVSKWGKKFGAKVGTTNLGGGGAELYLWSGNSKLVGPFSSRAEADEANESLYAGEAEVSAERDGNEVEAGEVHAIDITPSMREAVAEGQPLFSRRRDDQTQTPEFRRWFGDSKVVDENGEPLVVYHGTRKKFDAFRLSSDGNWGQGIYLTPDKELARGFGSNVVDAYVSLQNPVYRDAAMAAYNATGGDRDAVRQYLIDQGYDGIIVGREIVAFRPEQIKSATGNSGAFDPSDTSILRSRPRTPEQKTALAKAGMPVDSRGVFERISDMVAEKWQNLRDAMKNPKQRVFDRFHRMSAIEQDLGVAPEHSAYISARLSAGLPSIMESMMVYGAPKWEGGVLALKDNTVGLLDALKPVSDDLNGWLGWMVGRRAQALKRQGRENLMTDDDIKALLSLSKGREAEFKKAALDYLKIKEAVLDVAEQAGLINPQSRATWDSVEYIPFYRADEDTDRAIGPGTRKGLDGQNSGIRTLKGGEQNLADPLGNIIQNFTKLIDASLKNNAMLEAVDQYGPAFFEKVPMSGGFELIAMSQVKKLLLAQGVPQSMIDQMPPSALQGLQKMWAVKPPTDDDVVRVMRGGKPEYYRVPDPELLLALTSFKQPSKGWAVKPFIFAKRMLTAGVTTSPEFMLRNYIRDSGSSWVISDDKFRLGWDSVAGMIRPMIDDSDQKAMMAAGGSFIGGFVYGGNPQETASAIRRSLRAKGLTTRQIEDHLRSIARTPLQLWDKWNQIGSYIENANRNAIYRSAIESGRTPKEAAYMARDLMDFSMHGDSAAIQLLADVLPFFNARLQGLYKLYRQGGKKAVRRAMLARSGTIIAGTAALLAWNLLAHGDGYDELEEWDRDTYWHIAPGTEYHVRIPKPFELGVLFATIPERVLMSVIGKDRMDQTVRSFLAQVGGTLAMNPIPQAVIPIMELWANKSFFTGRPIENMGDEQMLPEARENWWTSDTAKLLADLLPDVANATKMSPKRIEHLWNGYTGTMGAYALETVDWMVRQISKAPDRPEMNWADMPLLKAIYRGDRVPSNTRYSTEFYDLMTLADSTSQTIKDYTESGGKDARIAELEAKHGWLLGERVASKQAKAGFMHQGVRDLRKVRDRLSQIRKEIDGIVAMPGFTSEQKRLQIDKLIRERNELTESTVTRLRSERQ
jgi:GGDEF domain-containing protein